MSEVVDFRDEVRNTVSNVVGIVDAVYTIDEVEYLDVQIGDRMHYKTPKANWEVVAKCDE